MGLYGCDVLTHDDLSACCRGRTAAASACGREVARRETRERHDG